LNGNSASKIMKLALKRSSPARRKLITALVSSTLFLWVMIIPATKADSLSELREDYRFIRNASIVDASIVDASINKARIDNAHEVSPLGFTANSLLTIYQTLISSQDNKVCNFSPSCSHFARDAVNRAGFIRGCLMASDRLSRCHPYSLGKYPIDVKTGKLVDPVDF
jgi:putative component of membrane protein insertase Oxa1/YidC/SpoIIIJ protein YidD